MDKCCQAIWETTFSVKQNDEIEKQIMDGSKSLVHCPQCDKRMWWWAYASSYGGDGSSELGLGCENAKCDGYEILPEDVAEALETEEERINA